MEEGSHLYTLDELYRLTAAAYAWNATVQQQAEQGATTLPGDEVYRYDGVGNRLSGKKIQDIHTLENG